MIIIIIIDHGNNNNDYYHYEQEPLVSEPRQLFSARTDLDAAPTSCLFPIAADKVFAIFLVNYSFAERWVSECH